MYKNIFPFAFIFLGLSAMAHCEAADLVFDETKFVYQSTIQSGSGNGVSYKQTYAAEGENKHGCTLYVYPKSGSTVSEVLAVDSAIMRPPITIAPLEMVSSKTKQYKEDAASIILLRNHKDSAKFIAVLHRVTLISEGVLRDIQMECSLRYEGFLGKSLAEFERLKPTWIESLFLLEPEIIPAS